MTKKAIFGHGTASEPISFMNRVAVDRNGRLWVFDVNRDECWRGVATHDANTGDDIEYMIHGNLHQLTEANNKKVVKI